MAFDLLFFKQQEQEIKLEEIISYFKTLPHFEVQTYDDINYSFVYFNEQDQVYFIINYNIDYELENNQLLESENFEFCNLLFTINYIRPSFFAQVALPIVYEFAHTFNLIIFNPQEPHNTLVKLELADLLRSWEENNLISCKQFNEQIPLKVLAKDKSDYAFFYMNEYEHIQNQLTEQGEPHFVPKMQFLKDTTEHTVYTAITWNNCLPIVLPKCDFVIALKETKSFFKLVTKEVPTVISYEMILEQFKDLFIPYESKIDNLLILPAIHIEQAQVIFNDLPVIDYEDLESVNTDDFVDCEL